MTRFPHDQFAKDYLKELLSPLGEVETSRDVPGEVREIDVFFTPESDSIEYRQQLGLLGRLATTPAIFEPFRNAVTASQIRSCMGKLFDIYADLERQAKRQEIQLTQIELPRLWILTPTASIPLVESFRAFSDENNWLSGIYFLADALKTAIVVIHQLPRTPETLWLRILGKGGVQKQAIDELAALPEDNPLRINALELLYNLQANLRVNQDLDAEDREFIMALAPLYRQQIDAAIQQGREEGRQEGRQEGR
ncbi:MAG TPA: flagellar assembly protein H, partial [Cyanobacteria bacterium UBA11162]|nr:flagellar assembly protein H [Cyanobacteria bacterium UBA11162]